MRSAYINVDSAASGRHFTASAVPALNRLIGEVSPDGAGSGGPYPASLPPSATRSRPTRCPAARPGSGQQSPRQRIGLHRLPEFSGRARRRLVVPGVRMASTTRSTTTTTGSRASATRDFRFHVALVRLWGLMLLRLANADTLPLDYEHVRPAIEEFVPRGVENVELALGISVPSTSGADALRSGSRAEVRRPEATCAVDTGTSTSRRNRPALMRAERACSIRRIPGQAVVPPPRLSRPSSLRAGGAARRGPRPFGRAMAIVIAGGIRALTNALRRAADTPSERVR